MPTKKKPTKKKATKSAAARKADRARVSSEGHEVAYLAKKHGVEQAVVTKAIAKAGHMRVAVEAAIKDFKKRSKAADRALVSSEPHEINYLAKKFNLGTDRVLAVVSSHGPARKKVEAALASLS